MVARFDALTDAITKKHKEASLLAFLKMDDNPDTWTMIYSSPEVKETEEGKEYRRNLFKEFAELLRESEKSIAYKSSEINRVGIFQLDNHIVIDALKYKAGTHITELTKMNGNMISEGFITISKSA